MSNTTFSGNGNSKYDSGLIIKEVHDYYGQSLRTVDTRAVVDQYFSHFRAEYDGSNKPTLVSYYRGTKAHITNFNVTAANTLLDGAYFTIRSAPDNQLWVVWFNLDNNSNQPIVANAKFIEININSGDTAPVVAMALSLTINALNKDVFFVTRNGSNIEIKTAGLGLVSDSDEGTTPFTFSQTEGFQELVKKIEFSYIGIDPVYEGQVLKGYSYDIYSGKFVKNPSLVVENVAISDSDGDKLQVNADGSLNVNVVSTAQILKSYFFEVTNVASGITESICQYTPIEDIYLQKIEFSGTNIATYELYINGVIKDRKLTYFSGNMEGVFNFDQGLNVSVGEIIEVRVYHNRPESGTFTARMQILESGA